jgi:hypothetical protein
MRDHETAIAFNLQSLIVVNGNFAQRFAIYSKSSEKFTLGVYVSHLPPGLLERDLRTL